MTRRPGLRIDVHAHLAVQEADALMRPHQRPYHEPALTFADEDNVRRP